MKPFMARIMLMRQDIFFMKTKILLYAEKWKHQEWIIRYEKRDQNKFVHLIPQSSPADYRPGARSCKIINVFTSTPVMRSQQFCLLILLSILFTSCSQSRKNGTQIVWDSWGVPHIISDDTEDLFYAQGWALMHNHANLILDLYGSARGKAAEYWGASRLQDDILMHTLGFDALADQWESAQEPELKTLISAFIRGMNDYARSHPEAIDEKMRIVLPLTTRDVNLHAMHVVFTRFIGGRELGRIQRWPDMGSNTYAIAPARSASGRAMLVQNPHLPWHKEFLFFESHFVLNGKSMYGATLVGIPGIAIGFNEHLGWSHTDNPLDNADTYELERKDGGYVLDGERKAFEVVNKTIRIRQDDGTLSDQDIEVYQTVHGPVIKKTRDKVLALRMAGLDRPNMILQWWRMLNSTNFDEFEAAVQMAEIPFWNVMYADRDGNIFYLFNGLLPVRSSGGWYDWNRIITGGRSADIWTKVHPYADLPKVKNPATGWLQNANDPPWTCTLPRALDPDDYPAYTAPQYMAFRPQRAARMIMEDESVTFNEMVDYKLSTRLEFADRILDDLFAAIDHSDSEEAKAGKKILENWDRMSDADSKGTLLFYHWAQKFQVWRSSNYAEPWDVNRPVTTPDGLSDPDGAVKLFEASVAEIKEKFGRLDVPWGEYYRIQTSGKDLPANGIDGSMGVFRVASPAGGDEGHLYVGGGDSWVGIIEFGNEVRAKVLLSYGNASQPDSPHFGDQLALFSRKEMRNAWFTEAAVKENAATVEILTEDGFRQKK
jgi:acyl-homoserine-lactone acylase